MMSLQQKLQKLQNSLLTVTTKTYHYFSPTSAKPPYMVWAENGEESSSSSDNHKSEQSVYGFIDFFTKTEFDPLIDQIQEQLNCLENCHWGLSSVQYGDPTDDGSNLIHYTWEWRL